MAKDNCETANALSVFWLKKHGYFHGSQAGGIRWTSGYGHESSIGFSVNTNEPNPHIRLQYTRTDQEGEKEDIDYTVKLASTPCRYGSKRYWFICPLVVGGKPCQRRVGILYLNGKYAGCRRCYDLAYQSQQESRRGGFLGVFGEYLRLGRDLEVKEDKIRVKYWRGQPTKRYARFLKKAEKLESFNMRQLEQERRKWVADNLKNR